MVSEAIVIALMNTITLIITAIITAVLGPLIIDKRDKNTDKGKTKKANSPIKRTKNIIRLIALVILVIGLVAICVNYVQTSNETSLSITSPADGVLVNMYEWVSGTSQSIPDGQHLWIIVRVEDRYFAHEVTTINPDGIWRHEVQIGQKDETGQHFDLMAVLADGSAHETLQNWRETWNTKSQYDLQSLPTGTTQYCTVTVIRR